MAHSSHLTQPLDLGIFRRLKSITRDKASYATRLEELDETVPDEDDEPEPVRAERGKAFADLALALLDAYERAATPKRAVSAFEQSGILYDIPDFHHPERKLAYVDPAHARAVNQYLGLFRGAHPRPRGQRGPIPIPDLNSNVQTPSDRPRSQEGRTMATGGHGRGLRGERRAG